MDENITAELFLTLLDLITMEHDSLSLLQNTTTTALMEIHNPQDVWIMDLQ